MLLNDTLLVTQENGIRPAGPQNQCLYCKCELGQPHANDCVCRRKTVLVRASFEVLMEVPSDWDAAMMESYWNDGSYCIDNVLDNIRAQSARVGCSCDFAEMRVIRDAEDHDHAKLNYGKEAACQTA